MSPQKKKATVQVTCVSEDDYLKCSDQREIFDLDVEITGRLLPVENEASALASVYIDCSGVADALLDEDVPQAVVYWHEITGSVHQQLANSFP